jgi:hypothetical protein
MARKPKTGLVSIKTDVAGMWINPRSNLYHGAYTAWDRRASDVWNSRYLELAEVALRSRSSEAKRANDAVGHLREYNLTQSSKS